MLAVETIGNWEFQLGALFWLPGLPGVRGAGASLGRDWAVLAVGVWGWFRGLDLILVGCVFSTHCG
jgi:hypothetical protein